MIPFSELERIGKSGHSLRFEVLTVGKMSLLFFWVVTLCGFIGRYQCFTETYYVSPSSVLQGATALKNSTDQS
jgi:hypothetical protein